MKEETVITKTTHTASNEPHIMTTENTVTPVIPVQIGSDAEQGLRESVNHDEVVKETHTVEKQ